MIIQLFIFGLVFFTFGVILLIRRKKVLGFMFVLLGIVSVIIGWIVVGIYPETLPF
jgi:hypothetical protein